MATILSNGFPVYSVNIIPKESLKQTLQTYAESIRYHVLYLFIKTRLLRLSQSTGTLAPCQTMLISILAAISSAIFILFLYPIKLIILSVSLCLKDPKIPATSPIKAFVRKLQDICTKTLYINSDTLHETPESSPFLKTFLVPETASWKCLNLEHEILKLFPTIPMPWAKIITHIHAKYLKNRNTSSTQEVSYEGSLYYSTMQKLTATLQDPTISTQRKQDLLNYIGSYACACPPTWIEVTFRELVEIYNKQDTGINHVLFCVQMFKENLLQFITNRSSEEWHHIAGFKHYHGRSLGLNMDALARIQFTSHLILKKQALYNRLYKRFLSHYRASVKNLIEYIRDQISESSQELKNSLSSYLCETMRAFQLPEHEIPSVLSSLFYDTQLELNSTGITFILLMQGILTTGPQTTLEKIMCRP
ncbi:hypothetical protein [Chlamydia felis Fe/C-56]|uniref:Uncharacterized protein n=1 Tax=Chlamydia felis (strain Fe/C-56) TaxID=264202 RepID=Q255Q2_CHLFF|nr:DUF1548 domain-containing protein [Chlamydia felis]BAE80986.1 hypothetical protein [Chlamydia felis Fe/C-56]